MIITNNKNMASMENYNSKLETKSVYSLYGQKDLINFTSVYQRGSVWKYNQKALFIDSIIKGIIPNNIIVNNKTDNKGIDICIDGKQRLQALFDFIDNKFPIKIDNKAVFFDKINKKLKIEDIDKSLIKLRMKCLNESIKGKFKKESIPFVTYQDLKYENEVEIFKRIQNGESLKQGEKIICNIKYEEVALLFRNFCIDMKDIFHKLYNDNEINRDKHIIFISSFMTMIHNDTYIPPSFVARNSYISSLSDKKEVKKILKKTNAFLQLFFQLFNNYTVEKKWNIKCLYTIMYVLYSNIDDHKNFMKMKKECNAVIHTINYYYNKIMDRKTNIITRKDIDELNDDFWNKNQEFLKNKKIENYIDDGDGDNDDDNDDDDNDDNDDDDEITIDNTNEDEDEDEDQENVKNVKKL